MKKVKSLTGETIKFRPDVKIISITEAGVVVDESTATLISERLGSQVSVEDTEEAIASDTGAGAKTEVENAELDETLKNKEATASDTGDVVVE